MARRKQLQRSFSSSCCNDSDDSTSSDSIQSNFYNIDIDDDATRKYPPKMALSDFPDSAVNRSIYSSKATFAPSMRQGLMIVSIIFVLGVYTGVAYVRWVQQHYGFGVNPLLERKYLPYGPSTEDYIPKKAKFNHSSDNDIASSSFNTKAGRKGIQLNRDNPHVHNKNQVMSTLFGVEYSSVIHAAQAETDTDNDPLNTLPEPKVSPEWYRLATTEAIPVTSEQTSMIQKISSRAHATIPNLKQRAQLVSWGGPSNSENLLGASWWHPIEANSSSDATMSDIFSLDGGDLLYSYLRIMRWDPNPQFPARLCGEQGCPPERAIAHSLEWREKYKPWLVPPSVLEENAKGYSYHRGFSPSTDSKHSKHATVWLRLGHRVHNELAFFRGVLHTADRAIADALIETKGESGKFNVIIDCSGFSLSNTPSLQTVKQAVTMLQDHFPNRLGMIFLVHLSRPGQVMLNMVLKLISKEVREKIKVLPHHDAAMSLAILKKVVEEDHIPEWLGGTDKYTFSVNEYYSPQHRCTEEEAQEFLTTMPYHAK